MSRTSPRLWFTGVAAAGLLVFSGCASPGPVHAYFGRSATEPIIDRGPDGSADVEITTHLSEYQDLYGIAYDPFTDHLFLRVFPGNFVLVVDRPAKRPKRAFVVEDLPFGRGDLTIRSRDRHLFFADPERPAVRETTLHGKNVRTITLAGLDTPPGGVAYDQARDRLLVLPADAPSRVQVYDLDGNLLSTVPLDRSVKPVSLAHDPRASEFYAPLGDRPAVGVFDSEGRLQRTLSFPDGRARDFVDVGQRSFLRLF